jgi:hypothetical protein
MRLRPAPTRAEARLQIVQAANRHILTGRNRRGWVHSAWAHRPTLLSGRHLQRAVCICRRNGLVSDEVLVAAGFRAVSR